MVMSLGPLLARAHPMVRARLAAAFADRRCGYPIPMDDRSRRRPRWRPSNRRKRGWMKAGAPSRGQGEPFTSAFRQKPRAAKGPAARRAPPAWERRIRQEKETDGLCWASRMRTLPSVMGIPKNMMRTRAQSPKWESSTRSTAKPSSNSVLGRRFFRFMCPTASRRSCKRYLFSRFTVRWFIRGASSPLNRVTIATDRQP